MKPIYTVLIFVLSIYKSCSVGEEDLGIEKVVSLCCTEGERWGTESKICSEFDRRLNAVPESLQGLCLSTIEICCSKQRRIYQCTEGQIAAKNGLSCLQINGNTSPDFYKDCCEACKVGLIIGSSDNRCSLDPFSFDQPLDEAYSSCCGELKADDAFILTEEDEKNLCGKFDKLCTQICENTGDSFICKCYDGYKLLEDRITCIPADDNFDNEITFNGSECRKGYKRDSFNRTCVDIDECQTGEADCDLEEQVCFNTNGAYRCIDVKEPSKCPDGYRYNVKTETCQDLNECLEELDNCNRETQHCFNTRGSFFCQDKMVETCLPGFVLNNSKICEDINECEDPDACPEPGYKCKNVIGSFECILISNKPLASSPQRVVSSSRPCELGFRRVQDKCVDIDECVSNPCDQHQKCINEIGGYRCECKIGFMLDPLTSACVDINECQINNHECLESQRCDNTIGSYTCIRLQSCGTGYTLNAQTGQCDDDDECALGRHTCFPPYECRNTKGSFRCVRAQRATTTTPRTTISTTTTLKSRSIENYYWPPPTVPSDQDCPAGFMANNLGACVDINECEKGDPCKWNQKCVNTNGSFKCVNTLNCPAGFMANNEGTQCVDIDECSTNEARCGPDQICKNKPGGYVCTCPYGMENKNFRCYDINECEKYKDSACPTNSQCYNTVGSYMCDCKPGFRKKNVDDKMCEDIDECSEIQGLCHQRCINYWGSYRCACDAGFKLNENNRTCDDIDECEKHKSFNLCMGLCLNTPGSYQCTCPAGYNLATDGRICEDIDECEKDNICKARNEVCTNTRGSYRCTRIDCPSGYIIDPARKNRCKRIDIRCDRDDIACFRKPSSFSYNFITITSNISLPPQGRALFNLRGPNWYESIDFDLKVLRVDAPPTVTKANEYFFSMNKLKNEVLLNLIQAIEGPQEIELELTMTVYQNGLPSGSNVAKIFILVSEYSF